MYQLSILTLEKTIFTGLVYSTLIPGADGYFEVLAHHAPLIALLQPGKVEIVTEDKKKQTYSVSGGFVEVAHNHATLFADSIQLEANTFE
jgi:F-type H+-transporting ATPase subunit epsilon